MKLWLSKLIRGLIKKQFKTLVTSWFTEESKAESEKNKKIRSKSNEPHVTGTKSFARLIHEERKKNNDVSPSRGKVYRISRTRKDGCIMNASAAEVLDKLKSISNASVGSTTEIETEVVDWRNNDIAKIKGPERRESINF